MGAWGGFLKALLRGGCLVFAFGKGRGEWERRCEEGLEMALLDLL